MEVRRARSSAAFWFIVCTALYLTVFSFNLSTASADYVVSFWIMSAVLSSATGISCALHGRSKFQSVIQMSVVVWVVLFLLSITKAAKVLSIIQ